MNNLNVRREEYKYYINHADTFLLREVLRKIMQLDTNANPITKEYTVSSLYFDTVESHDLNDKLDGILKRKKHRVRIYNNNITTIKLETKKREGTVISKDSVNISTEIANHLINNNYGNLRSITGASAQYENILANLKSQGYRSRVIVEYDREAYYLPYGNIRITLDKNLRTYNACTDLLNLEKHPKSPIFLNNDQVLEIKFSEPLPPFLKNVLSSFFLVRCSISKYVLSQRYTDYSARRDFLINPF